jgi:hypothetical protein
MHAGSRQRQVAEVPVKALCHAIADKGLNPMEDMQSQGNGIYTHKGKTGG